MPALLERMPSGNSAIGFFSKAAIAVGSLVILDKIIAPVNREDGGFRDRNGRPLVHRRGRNEALLKLVETNGEPVATYQGLNLYAGHDYKMVETTGKGQLKRLRQGGGGHLVAPFMGKARTTNINVRVADIEDVTIDLKVSGQIRKYRVDAKASYLVENSTKALEAAIYGNTDVDERAKTLLIGGIERAGHTAAESTPFHQQRGLDYDPSEILGDSERMLGRVLTPDFADHFLGSCGAHLLSLEIKYGGLTPEEVTAQGNRDAATIIAEELGRSVFSQSNGKVPVPELVLPVSYSPNGGN